MSGDVYQRGEAAYYARSFDGRRTASGDRFDSGRLTAAHRRLPFGSRVEVTNENNGRSVIVTINDRGPYTRGRIIDLSRRAAGQIGMIRSGIAPVTLRLVD
nr:septal ring lytic transglycosylase RlpA family protein [Salinisphaera sp.]